MFMFCRSPSAARLILSIVLVACRLLLGDEKRESRTCTHTRRARSACNIYEEGGQIKRQIVPYFIKEDHVKLLAIVGAPPAWPAVQSSTL